MSEVYVVAILVLVGIEVLVLIATWRALSALRRSGDLRIPSAMKVAMVFGAVIATIGLFPIAASVGYVWGLPNFIHPFIIKGYRSGYRGAAGSVFAVKPNRPRSK